jgi:HEAT repeat protein
MNRFTHISLALCLLAGCDTLSRPASRGAIAPATQTTPSPMSNSDAKRIAHNAQLAYRNSPRHDSRAAQELGNSVMILLAGGNATQRSQAAIQLGELRHRAAEEPLRLALLDPSPAVRREACNALGRAKSPSAAFAVAGCFHDVNLAVQISALKAAGRLNNPAVLPAVLKCTTSSSKAVATVAVRSAGILASVTSDSTLQTQSVKQLTAAAANPSVSVRSSAVAALGRIASPAGLAAICKAAADREPLVRFQAAGALKRYADPLAKQTLSTLRKDPNQAVRTAAK